VSDARMVFMVERGFEVDDLDGDRVGTVHSLYLDAEGGEPVWLVARLGRRRRVKLVAVPLRNCAGGGGRVWVAHERAALRLAPSVDPSRPLLREHELAICAHYGIGERVGRASEVAGRPEGAVTAQPA
jgi:PRC-barrel domain